MKTTLNPFENAKRTANGTGGGVSPAVIEEIQAEISVLGSQLEELAGAYSTTEHKTGRKWIDGKDIYQKVITLESAEIVSSTGYKLSSDTNYETLIDVKLINGASVTSGYAFVQSDGLYISNTSQWTTSVIIIEYTKSTV